MGNVIHKIVDGDHCTAELEEQRRLLIEETGRLNQIVAELDVKNGRLMRELERVVTSSDLAIEFVKDQGIDWIEDGFEELQIRKFQAFLKKKREEGTLLTPLPPPPVATDLSKSVHK